MRIDHVVPAIDEDATGVAYSVPALCSTLLALGDDVYLHSLGAPPSSNRGTFITAFIQGCDFLITWAFLLR